MNMFRHRSAFTQRKKRRTASSLRYLRTGLLLLSMSGSIYLVAAPYIPASDDEVLIVLPVTADISANTAASAVIDGITDVERIGRAQRLLAIAYESTNEDAFGQAEALLTTWSESENLAAIPVEVQFMLAVIRQHNHEFAEALALLDMVLQRQPASGAALLQHAQINLVLGNYAVSRQNCEKLLPLVSTVITTNCLAQVAAVTGHAAETFAQLTTLAMYGQYFAQVEYVELVLTLATVAHRLGRFDEAEDYYRRIMELGNNIYAILQFADFLLEQQRFAEVLALLAQLPAEQLSLELQVKRLEALHGIGNTPAYADEYRQLEEVFAVARTRAENFPNKEYARFLLQTPQHAPEALQAALANWQYQKEPGDLLLLVRAARAADTTRELERAKSWLASTGLEDIRINSLLGLPAPQKPSAIEGETDP